MSSKTRIIDLTEDISPKTRILLSKEEGTSLESKHNIAFTLIRVKGKIEIIFPDTLYAIGSLAFSQMFELPYRKCGDVEFGEKVTFIASDACLHSINDCFSILKEKILDEGKSSPTAYVDTEV
jgi:hypothetical protein